MKYAGDVIKMKDSKKMEGGSRAKDTSTNGVIFVEGRKLCKHCGNPIEN